jgi:hypothetical protein
MDHISIAIDKDNSFKALAEIQKTYPQQVDRTAIERIEQLIDRADPHILEMWIGRRDSLPYRVTIVTSLPEGEREDGGKMSFTVSMRKFNESVSVKIPVPAITAKEAFLRVSGKTDGTASKLQPVLETLSE